MTNVIALLPRKSAASKERVAQMVCDYVAEAKERDRRAALTKARQVAIAELKWAARKMWAVYGEEPDAVIEQTILLAISTIREERRMKQRIKGE